MIGDEHPVLLNGIWQIYVYLRSVLLLAGSVVVDRSIPFQGYMLYRSNQTLV